MGICEYPSPPLYRIELCIYTRFLQSPTLENGQMPVYFVLFFVFSLWYTFHSSLVDVYFTWRFYLVRLARAFWAWYTYVVIATKIYI